VDITKGTTPMKRFSLTAIAFVALTVPALAGGTSVVVTGTAPMGNGGYQSKSAAVTFTDLDIATAPGAAALLDRIAAASRVVCGERSGTPMNGERQRELAQCAARATKQAVEAINTPALSQVAAAQ
jgi:UrcA family protein